MEQVVVDANFAQVDELLVLALGEGARAGSLLQGVFGEVRSGGHD